MESGAHRHEDAMLNMLNERLDERRAARAPRSILAQNPLSQAQGSVTVTSVAGKLKKIAALREARQVLELLWEDSYARGDVFSADELARTERMLRDREATLLQELF